MDETSFGDWLRRLRQERGLTQEALARTTGCATQTVRKIEHGQRRPSYQLAARLAHVLALAPESHARWMQAARAAEHGDETAFGRPRPAPSSRLPIYLTPFVGREREQDQLAALLHAREHRLVVLAGHGGVGKTRLAVEVARSAEGFPGGIVFVPLASVASPHALVPAIGEALGISFSGPSGLAAQLLASLHDRRILLILDNLEHLLDPAGETLALLERLLVEAPNITILVTSRERLWLPGAATLVLDGFALPPSQAAASPERFPALALFAEHARRVERDFQLGSENVGAVAAICRLVDGLPLGIELAAAWVHMLTPEEIAAELSRSLTTGRPNDGAAPLRHRSLSTVVEHSWQLLSDGERISLMRLAVFRGGFTRAAAESIAGASLAILTRLIDTSLLRRVAADRRAAVAEAAGASLAVLTRLVDQSQPQRTVVGRYELHQIVRQYALGQLESDASERTVIGDRHAAYYLGWLAEREGAIKGAGQIEALAAVSGEIDNIRAAWGWAITHRQLDLIERSAEALQWFCVFRGWYEEGAALFRQAAEQLQAPADTGGSHARVLGRVLGHSAALTSRVAAFAEARAAVEQSVALLEACGDHFGLTRSWMYQGLILVQQGDYQQARQALDRSRELAGPDDEWAIAFCEAWGCMVAHALGEYAEAERLFHSALARYRAMGNASCVILCLALCSVALLARERYAEAEPLLHEGLVLAASTGDRWGMAMVLQHLGVVAIRQDQLDEAEYLFHEALALLRESGNRLELARALNYLGATLQSAGARGRAKAAYREALAAAQAADGRPEAQQAEAGLAALDAEDGQPARALARLAQILANPATRADTREQALRLRERLAKPPGDEQGWAEGPVAPDLSETAGMPASGSVALTPSPELDAPFAQLARSVIVPLGGCYIAETGETLSAREVEVLRLLMAGASNPLIATQLVVSPFTVKNHVANILQKLRVSSRTAAAMHGRALGLEPLPLSPQTPTK